MSTPVIRDMTPRQIETAIAHISNSIDLSAQEVIVNPRPINWRQVAKVKVARVFRALLWQRDIRRSEAYITAVIPAHNEEKDIAAALESLIVQTRQVDHIIVVVNNSTDKTVEICRMFAREFRGYITVEENPIWVTPSGKSKQVRGKVAALNYAWMTHISRSPFHGDEEYVFGMDADVVLEPDCVEQLERALLDDMDDHRVGGVRATYGFAAPSNAPLRTRSLVAGQRLDFAASELRDQLRGNCKVTILGGQATLFRREALEKVNQANKAKGPWNPNSLVEDAYLTRQLEQLDYVGIVNPRARATVGAMKTTHAWWNQRRKWQNGHLGDIASDKRFALDRARWSQQLALGWNWLLRVLFVMFLSISLIMGTFEFSWIWLTPIVVAAIQNTLVVMRMKDRSGALILRAATYVLPEIYIWKILAVWLVSGKKGFLAFVNTGRSNQDDWLRQARAESSRKVGSWSMWLTIVLSVAVPTGMVMALGFAFPEAVEPIVTYGWWLLATMTVISTAFMLIKIVRILMNYSRLSL